MIPTIQRSFTCLALHSSSSAYSLPAQKNYEKSWRLRPDHVGLLREIGRLSGQTGDYESAHRAFNRAIALEPNEPLNYFYLGEFLEKIGDLRNAAGAYLNAQNLAPLWDKPVYRLGQVYGKLDRLARWLLLSGQGVPATR